jgi:hypothetical protein
MTRATSPGSRRAASAATVAPPGSVEKNSGCEPGLGQPGHRGLDRLRGLAGAGGRIADQQRDAGPRHGAGSVQDRGGSAKGGRLTPCTRGWDTTAGAAVSRAAGALLTGAVGRGAAANLIAMGDVALALCPSHSPPRCSRWPAQARPTRPSRPRRSRRPRRSSSRTRAACGCRSRWRQHAETLKKLGLGYDPAALTDPTAFPLGAVVSLGGCSASFVSPDGPADHQPPLRDALPAAQRDAGGRTCSRKATWRRRRPTRSRAGRRRACS